MSWNYQGQMDCKALTSWFAKANSSNSSGEINVNPSFSGEKVTPENQFEPSARTSTRLSTTHRSHYRSDSSGKLRFDFSSRADAPATLWKRAAVHCGRREAAFALDEGWNKRLENQQPLLEDGGKLRNVRSNCPLVEPVLPLQVQFPHW